MNGKIKIKKHKRNGLLSIFLSTIKLFTVAKNITSMKELQHYNGFKLLAIAPLCRILEAENRKNKFSFRIIKPLLKWTSNIIL